MSRLGRLQPQQPAIVSAALPGQVTAAVTDTENAATTATASASASTQNPQPIVVVDLTDAYGKLARQPGVALTVTPPGQVGASVTDTETASTTTATTVAGIGTQPIVVSVEPSKAFWNQAHQPPAIVIATPPGQVNAAVSTTETASTTASAQTQPQTPPQPIVVSVEPSKAFWNQAHQPPAILSATPPGTLSGAVSTSESATTTTAATVAGEGTAPIVVSDLTGTYWTLQRQRPAIVVIQPPGKVTADVSDTETASTTATASATPPPTATQPVVYSDQLSPYLRRATHHQPPTLLITPPAGVVLGQVTTTETAGTTATATAGGAVSGAVTATETSSVTATASAGVRTGSWWSLVTLLQQSRDEVELTAQAEEGFCPHDHTPYVSNAQGALICPFDGYSPDPGAVRATQGQREITPAAEQWRELDAWHPNVDPAEVYW